MKIVHVNTHDIWGGAALAAHRLHSGLRAIGQDSTLFVAHREGAGENVLAFVPPSDFKSRLTRTIRREFLTRALSKYDQSRPAGGDLFSDDRSQHGDAPLRQLPPSDILNLHWISEFLDAGSLFRKLPGHTRVVWTLHDMNAFTGGCHYDAGCGKHRATCGVCPQLGATDRADLSSQIWNRRRRNYSLLSSSDLQLVAPSRWMAGEIRESALLGRFPVTVIPNGVDLDDFAPRNRAFARDTLGLPRDAKVLLFAAHTVVEKRKGFSVLLEALSGLREVQNFHLLAVGAHGSPPQTGIPCHPLGYISNSRLLSIVYSASDLCVVPSLQDNLPNIAIESLACGTPVVGFDVGGMPEIVNDGQTGHLVRLGDSSALRESIRRALTNSATHAEMRANCRQSAVENFSIQRQALNYVRMYESLYESVGQNSINPLQ